MSNWLRDVFAGRPWWLNAMMVFCAFMTFVYVPWDIFWKPLSADHEVWFGYAFEGWSAKLAALVHWWVYGALLYGLRRMRPWARLGLTAYLAQVAFGMFVWSAVEYGSWTGFFLGLIAAAPFLALTSVVWNARDHFRPARSLAERYGEWALITGASSGIGAEFARAVAAEGVSCVLTARSEGRLRSVAEELESNFGVRTRVVAEDLTTADGPRQVLAAIRDLEVSILINNAGVGYVGRFDLQEEGRLRELIELNCTAPALLANGLLPGMRERRRGAVIFTGSVSGKQPIPLHALYSASKVFEQFLGEALWVESRDVGIDVLVLEPGSTSDTDFQAVAGQVPHSGEAPSAVVRAALEALGRQPTVVTTWFDWARAEFATRVAPRNLVTYVARDVLRKHTPTELR
jgi:short-subunit dehydrogenase